jgi:hypothetical protein
MNRASLFFAAILLLLFCNSYAQQTRTIYDSEIIYGKPMNVITFQYGLSKRPGSNKVDTTLRDTVFYDQNGNTLESHTRTGYQQTYSLTKFAGRYDEHKVKVETNAPTRYGSISIKYNENGQIKELDNLLRDGKIAYKALYKYDAQGNPLEYDQFDDKDTLRLRRIYQRNDKGFVTTQKDYSVLYNTSNPKDRAEGQLFSTITYTYDAFDDKGNWTKRTTYVAYENAEPRKQAITERKIFYYK